MRKNDLIQRISALALVAALLCTCAACVQKPEASTIRLMRTEGTVSITDFGGKGVEPQDSLMLYSGYGMKTQRISYAWINLDEVKLTKMDEKSEIAITKEGKALEIEVKSGSLFFHVTQPLGEDETMTIRSSTMAVGIRGTCGWVSQSEDTLSVYLLEGKVRCESDGQRETVQAGEMAVMTPDGEIQVKPFTAAEIPAFVAAEIADDEDLAEAILDASGLDVLNPPDPNEAARTAYNQVLAEYQDAHVQGLDLLTEYSDGFDWTNPPDLSGYQYINDDLFTYGWPNYYAYYDIDGNGVEELIMIELTEFAGNVFRFNRDIYAVNGDAPVLLSDQTGVMGDYSVLTDGTILKYVGNGGMIGKVYRLSPDGFTLEDVPDSPLLGSYEWPSERMLINILDPIPLY